MMWWSLMQEWLIVDTLLRRNSTVLVVVRQKSCLKATRWWPFYSDWVMLRKQVVVFHSATSRSIFRWSLR